MLTLNLPEIEELVQVKIDDSPHIPVMPDEVIRALNPDPGAVIVDGTVGCGGHAHLLAERVGPNGRLIGIDRDTESLKIASGRLSEFSPRCTLVHDDFRHIAQVLDRLDLKQVDGMLFDLGISSFQLNDPDRGFSIQSDGPLDMRMDRESYISAYDLINSLSEHEISLILKNYGDERLARRIARSVVYHRTRKPIQSTKDLEQTVMRALPRTWKRGRIHPATRTFQAFRIAVNRELEAIEVLLEACLDYLKPGGKICIIAFHSLEDRIVKQKFRAFARDGRIRLLTKKPLRPSDDEVSRNPRARSARLRAAEKI